MCVCVRAHLSVTFYCRIHIICVSLNKEEQSPPLPIAKPVSKLFSTRSKQPSASWVFLANLGIAWRGGGEKQLQTVTLHGIDFYFLNALTEYGVDMVLYKYNLSMVPKLSDIVLIKLLIGSTTDWWGDNIGKFGFFLR